MSNKERPRRPSHSFDVRFLLVIPRFREERSRRDDAE